MNANCPRYALPVLLMMLVLSFAAIGQGTRSDKQITAAVTAEAKAVRSEDHELDSKLMSRAMPYRVLLPPSYANKLDSSRYPVVYLLHGLTGHYSNWSDKTDLSKFAAAHNFILVMPEGDNGWYTDSAATPNDKYESYIIKELIPEIDKKFRTIADRGHRSVAGLSMGGYGALKFGLKYPELFSIVGSFSGAFGVAEWTADNAGNIGRSIDGIFGPAGSDTRQKNDIFKLVGGLSPDKVKSLPFIYLSCGTEDQLLKLNAEFLRSLFDKKIPHEFRQRPGGHTWTFWNDQAREFLDVAERYWANGSGQPASAGK